MVFLSNRLIIFGLIVLALAMTGVMLMIGDFLFGRVVGIAIGAVTATTLTALWSVIPLRERSRSQAA